MTDSPHPGAVSPETAAGAFAKLKACVLEAGLAIVSEDECDEILVIADEANGLSRVVIDYEAPLVVLEQQIMELAQDPSPDVCLGYRRLLQMNRTLVQGAFVLDERGVGVIFRDTLPLALLDRDALARSISALIVALAEYGDELLGFSRDERNVKIGG